MHSLILIVALLFTVLASPTLRHRLVQDVDAYGNLDDLEGNIFNTFTAPTVPDLASANLEGAGWTASIGTTPDPQGYQTSTVGDNIDVGASEQQDSLLIAKAQVKPGWNPNAQNPCPNLFTLCTKKMQYFPLGWISNAFPYDAALDPDFEECGRRQIYCCINYYEDKRRGGTCYGAY